MKYGKYFWGIILIIIGLIGILDKIFNISIDIELWPMIILILGICFEVSFFTSRERKNVGILVPGGILTTIGILFLFETVTNWRFSGYTWPIYTLSVAIGIFQLYWFGKRDRALLVPVAVLTAITVIAFTSMAVGNVFEWLDKAAIVPIAIFILGLWILFKKDGGHKEDKNI